MCPSITDVFQGALWHERETHEMFGIDFEGHPRLVNLYLPEDFDGNSAPALLQAPEPRRSRTGPARRIPKKPRRVGRWRRPRTASQDSTEVVRQVARPKPFETQEMILNVGPQHPATHGVFRLLATIDGEILVDAEPVIGYMHRGYEKLVEARDYRQITNLVSRMDWLSGINNELPLCAGGRKLMEIEVPPRAQYLRVIMCEMNRILNHLMFFACFGAELGAITPTFYAFREREDIQYAMEMVPAAACTSGSCARGLEGGRARGFLRRRARGRASGHRPAPRLREPADRQRDLQGAHDRRRRPRQGDRAATTASPARSRAGPTSTWTSARTSPTSSTTSSTSTSHRAER